jgi:hypothetical protein
MRRLYHLGLLVAICVVAGSCSSQPVTPHRSPTASSTFAYVGPSPTDTVTTFYPVGPPRTIIPPASGLDPVSATVASYPGPEFPGVVNPEVRQDNLDSTICNPGYTKRIRPPVTYTNPIKIKLMAQLHLPGTIEDYELDHKLAEEVGGGPRDPRNLWMEPRRGPYGALVKDQIENRVHRDLCTTKTLTLAQAQAIFLDNTWWTAQIP